MSNAVEFTINVGYGDIACKVWGENIPATQKFLALHGFMDNAGTFDPLMEYFLNNDRCVVCIDLPGHGLSSHLPKGVIYSPERDFYAMKRVIRHLGWKKCKLMGHSLGANRCLTYAMIWPEEIEAVISFDGFIIPSEVGKQEVMMRYKFGDINVHFDSMSEDLDEFLDYSTLSHRRGKEHSFDKLADRWLKAVPGLTLPDVQILVRRGAKKLGNGKYIYTRDPALFVRTHDTIRYPIATIKHRLQMMKDIPLIILTNGSYGFPRDGEALMNSLVTKMTHAYPCKFEMVTVDGTHYFVMQQQKLVAAIVNKFLDEVNKDNITSKL